MNRHRRARFCAWLVCLGCLAWAGWAWAAQAAPLAPGPAAVPPRAADASDFPFALPYLETVGDSESIPDGVVTALAQDARGLVWIGTAHGLLRYDGYRFRRFVHDANDPTSLAADYVASLWAAGDGRIWVGGNSDGLSVFDPGSERFTRFAHDPKRPNSLAAGRIWALAGDAQGGLWIAAEHGLASLGGLVAGIAHEINTPLGTSMMAISGAADSWERLRLAISSGKLTKSILDSMTEEGIEYTALAGRTASRAAELIRTFKTIALHTDGDRVGNVDLAQFVPEIASLVSSSLAQGGIELRLDVPASLPVKIVSDALIEALTRILTNVVDHTFREGRTGHVQVRVAADRQEVVIEIADNGHGIAPVDLPKVFDPFFTTRSGTYGHVGLGLHVAFNHVTQRLKGKIEVASRLGEGTTVTMRFKSAS